MKRPSSFRIGPRVPAFLSSAILGVLAWLVVSAQSETVSQEPSPSEVTFSITRGVQPLPITRFPLLVEKGVPAEQLTLNSIFGKENTAGLEPGNAKTADLIWVFVDGTWFKFYYWEAISPRDPPTGWKLVGDDVEDWGEFQWPYTAGVLVERRQETPTILKFRGVPRLEPTQIIVSQGSHFYNRVYDDPVALTDLQLESFFIPVDEAILDRPIDPTQPGNPNNGENFPGDRLINPESRATFVLLEGKGWFELTTRQPIDPQQVRIPGAFQIIRVGRPVAHAFTVEIQRHVFVNPSTLLGLHEGALRRVRGSGFAAPECTCAVLFQENGRPITFHVTETGPDYAVMRVGKYFGNPNTRSLSVVTGRGFTGRLTSAAPGLAVERQARSFFSDQAAIEPTPFGAQLTPPKRRPNEFRFASLLSPVGALTLNLPDRTWEANTLLEIDLVAGTVEGQKIALHLPQVRITEPASTQAFAEQLAALLRQALLERELLPSADFRVVAISEPLGGAATLFIDLGIPLSFGKIDLCGWAPVQPPLIQSTSTTVTPNGFVQIRGERFGRRLEDLCMVLVPANGEGRTLPLRPLGFSPSGRSLIARVVGNFDNAQPRRLMMARGFGRTRPIDMGFPDVFQRQGMWVWRGIGLPPVTSPNTLTPILGQTETAYYTGELIDGSLKITIDQPWPENAEVSISFTANTDTVQLDGYAPELCFTVSGSTEECAKRLQRVLKAAFVQGGMASENEVEVQRSVDGDVMSLTVDIFTQDGVRDPITNGHLNISVGQVEDPCLPPSAEDSDGDFMQDSWETDSFFDMALADISPLSDPDGDGLSNHVEFAFNTNPDEANGPAPLEIFLDESEHPLVAFDRHVAAPNFYHFDLETSMDGDYWESLPNLEILTVTPVGLGTFSETVLARVLVDAHELTSSFYRLQITPKS